MNYTLHTQFSTAQQNAGGMRASQMGVLPNRNLKYFESNKVYELYYIRPHKDAEGVQKFEFQFRPDQGELVNITFDELRFGDEFIASLRNEELPDYTEVYENRGD